MKNATKLFFNFIFCVGLFGLLFGIGARGDVTPRRSRVDFSATTWQEPLQLTSASGSVDKSVANYKGMLLSYERLIHNSWGGYGFGGVVGSGSASGGGTSSAVPYQQGTLPWTLLGIQPRIFYALSDRVALGASSTLVDRNITWPGSATVQVDPSKMFNVIFTLDIDFNLSDRFGFRQSWGAWSADVGPFWRWGLTYDFD